MIERHVTVVRSVGQLRGGARLALSRRYWVREPLDPRANAWPIC
jgi:hypothetical protein